jgi:hypothetical protein
LRSGLSNQALLRRDRQNRPVFAADAQAGSPGQYLTAVRAAALNFCLAASVVALFSSCFRSATPFGRSYF